jgi:hypothetical protein
MMRSITAIQLHHELTVGRNRPVLLSGEDSAGATVEVVAKFSHRCERGNNALIAESVSAMFAADLDLPVPQPFVVHVDPELAQQFFDRLPGRHPPDPALPAYGSRYLPGFNVLLAGKPLAAALRQVALEVVAFDVLIQNNDRLPSNPNCITNGEHIAIIDHELAFVTGIIGWRPPWEPGSLASVGFPNPHLFYSTLRGTPIDLTRLVGAVQSVSDNRLDEYLAALPGSWIGAGSQESEMIAQLRAMRAHIADIVSELRGALR